MNIVKIFILSILMHYSSSCCVVQLANEILTDYSIYSINKLQEEQYRQIFGHLLATYQANLRAIFKESIHRLEGKLTLIQIVFVIQFLFSDRQRNIIMNQYNDYFQEIFSTFSEEDQNKLIQYFKLDSTCIAS